LYRPSGIVDFNLLDHLGSNFFVFQRARSAAPLLANYYWATLPTDSESIKKLSKNDLLILSPEQAIVRKNVIDQIKHDKSGILFAGLCSQSKLQYGLDAISGQYLYR